MIRAVHHLKLDDSLGPRRRRRFWRPAQRARLPAAEGRLRFAQESAACTRSTIVRQTFHNAFAEAIEATYIFPLPDRAAVTSFTLRVAGRVVEGVLRERQQARAGVRSGDRRRAPRRHRRRGTQRHVQSARRQRAAGRRHFRRAGTRRPADGGTWRGRVSLSPWSWRRVTCRACRSTGRRSGLGVAPDTDQVPDASRITPPVLLPGFPNPVRLALEVEFEAAACRRRIEASLNRFRSSLHSVIVDDVGGLDGAIAARRALEPRFHFAVLLGRPGGARACFHSPRPKNRGTGTFALSIVPPAETADPRAAARYRVHPRPLREHERLEDGRGAARRGPSARYVAGARSLQRARF